MLANYGRKLFAVGLLLAGASLSSSAADLAATQQAAAGQSGSDVAEQAAAPAVAQQSFAVESSAGSGSMRPASHGYRRSPARQFATAGRSCAHLGCRGVHVLGVGY